MGRSGRDTCSSHSLIRTFRVIGDVGEDIELELQDAEDGLVRRSRALSYTASSFSSSSALVSSTF